jgi:hypothetical protein
MIWSLPKREQRLIGNYAIGGSTQVQEDQLLRYLIEQRGLLESGGDKVLIVFDLFFGEANHSYTVSDGGPLWRYIFTRGGLYTYDRIGGIHAANLSALGRAERVAVAQDDAFWKWTAGLSPTHAFPIQLHSDS